MRNKQAFIDDVEKVIKEEILKDVNFVEDAAHAMHHTETPTYIVGGIFTKSGQPVQFNFDIQPRPSTAPVNFPGDVDDFVYLDMAVDYNDY